MPIHLDLRVLYSPDVRRARKVIHQALAHPQQHRLQRGRSFGAARFTPGGRTLAPPWPRRALPARSRPPCSAPGGARSLINGFLAPTTPRLAARAMHDCKRSSETRYAMAFPLLYLSPFVRHRLSKHDHHGTINFFKKTKNLIVPCLDFPLSIR